MTLGKVLILGVFAVFTAPLSVQAASLSVTASPTTVLAGNTVTVSVLVNSEGIAINNAEGSLTFPRELFDVVSVSSDVSIFSLWIQAPTYNGNSAISFNGGVPSPGYLGSNGKVFSVVLRAKSSGSASFALVNTAVRANDGLGTNVLSRSTGASVVVQALQNTPVTQPQLAGYALTVFSETHPIQDRWYKAQDARLSWELPAGTDAVQTLLSDSSRDLPAVLYSPAISEKKLDDLEDGIWYFAIRARTTAGWGSVVRYKLQVDSVPPVVGETRVEYVGNERLPVVRADADTLDVSYISIKSSASDDLSGVAQAEFFVDQESLKRIDYRDFTDEKYRLPVNLKSGEHTLFVRYYDAAGNSADSDLIRFEVVRQEVDERRAGISMLFTLEERTTLLLICALLLSFASILMNIVLWNKLRRIKRDTRGGGLSKLQQNTRQKLQALMKDVSRQRKEFDREHKRRDIAPKDAEHVKKMRAHLTEAEEYLAEKIRQVSKE